MIPIELYKSGCSLGEGAMWHNARRSFFWVDIEQRKFYECRWIDRRITKYEIDHRVSLVLETSKPDTILLGVQGGLMSYDLLSGQQQWVTEIERNIPDNRTNDGACDAAGRVWIGTMNIDCIEGRGTLYRWQRNHKPEPVIADMSIPNGIVWSLDGNTMYHVESHERVVRAYSFDTVTGEIIFNHVAIEVPEELGSPDGMCMDDEGMLWIAHWGGYGVYRWNAINGKLITKIEVPVPHVSSCAFGGNDMRTLLITTARQGLTTEQLQREPASGNVFIANPGYKGASRYIARF